MGNVLFMESMIGGGGWFLGFAVVIVVEMAGERAIITAECAVCNSGPTIFG